MSKGVTVVVGDSDFRKTLTEKEKEYIGQGCNWLGKWAREIEIKSLHNIGYTLDKLEKLPIGERLNVEKTANETWNKKIREESI